MTEPRGTIVPFDDLAHTEHAHEFVGAEHGEGPFCVILVHSKPGAGRSCIATRTPKFSPSRPARRPSGSVAG